MGRTQNISFYGDIIGRVFTRPHENGYEWLWHPSAKLDENLLWIGPVISPIEGRTQTKRKTGKDGIEARGDLFKKFIGNEPTLSHFRKFAESYGLLGITSLPTAGGEADGRTSEPLVLWLQHYCRLRLLDAILLPESSFDRLRFFEQQMFMRQPLTSVLGSASLRLCPNPQVATVQRDYSGAQLSANFETVWPSFPCTLNDLALRNEAFRVLTEQLSAHCRIVVRTRGKRRKIDVPEGFGEYGRDARLITTSLEPKGLLGAMYVGILLRLSGGSFNARASTGCLHCGAPVPNPKPNKKYCDDKCKHKAKRMRAKNIDERTVQPNV